MDTVESLKQRLRTAEDVHALVRTMKALAAVNIRQLEQAVESLAEYKRTIELGFRVVLRNRGRSSLTSRSAPQQSLGTVLFGTDQGMCGQLNDQITAFTLDHIGMSPAPAPHRATLVIGVRAAARLEDAGITPDAVLPAPSSAGGVTSLVQEILLHLERWHQERRVDHIVAFYSEHVSRSAYRPRHLDLLPIDRRWLAELEQVPWPTRTLPSFTMDADRLLSALVRQYLFVWLFRACAESLASENASRLAAMRGAERNIGERIGELTRQFHQTRQMAITEELLDIAAGFEASEDG